MSWLDCLKENLTARQFERIEEKYKKIVRHHEKEGGGVDAADKAAEEIIKTEMRRIARSKANSAKQAQILTESIPNMIKDAEDKMEEWDKAISNTHIRKFLAGRDKRWTNLVFNKPSVSRELGDKLERIESNAGSRARIARQGIADILKDYEVDIWGNPTPETVERVEAIMRAAGGDDVGNQAIQAKGAQLRKVLDELADEYRAEGGNMGEIKNWLPQIHNSAALREMGETDWINYISRSLDWDEITDDFGYKLFSNSEFNEAGELSDEAYKFLQDVYKTLSTDGANKVASKGEQGGSMIKGAGSISTRRGHSRVLHFKSTKDQLEYSKRLGVDDPFASVLNHIETMSRDISIMKELGPNPDSYISNVTMRLSDKEKIHPHVDRMYKVLTGRTSMTGAESESFKLYKGSLGYLRAAHLGSAVIPAVGDVTFNLLQHRFSGLGLDKAMKEYLTPSYKGADGKALAIADQYTFEYAQGSALNRFLDDGSFIMGGKSRAERIGEWGQNASNLVMRGSGLSWWTEMGKNTMMASAVSKTGALHGRSWKHLIENHPDFVDAMKRYGGITEADWKVINKAKPTPAHGSGVPLITPDEILDADDEMAKEVAIKFGAYIDRLRKLSTNEPTLKTKGVTTWGAESGTAGRALADSIGMYRAFPISMWNNYIREMMTRNVLMGAKTGTVELGGFMIASLMMGYGVLVAKDAAKGKTARDFDAREAMLQSGGLGIFGDFVVQDQSRFGQSVTETIAGVPAGFFADTYKLLRGDSMEALFAEEGQTSDYQQAVTRYLGRYTPGASLWYIRGVWNNVIPDSTKAAIEGDKYYQRKMRERKRMAKMGQEFIGE